jgi:hypothetical protein
MGTGSVKHSFSQDIFGFDRYQPLIIGENDDLIKMD